MPASTGDADDHRDRTSLARGLMAFGALAVAAYVVHGSAGEGTEPRYMPQFVVSTLLLAFVLPWPRCSWADVNAVTLGCTSGFATALVIVGGTADSGRWDVGPLQFYALGTAVAWLACLAIAALARGLRTLFARR